jgi:transposase InsO family protein
MESRLAVNALLIALSRRHSKEGLIVHSDRGMQFASKHYQRTLKRRGIPCSMSRKGNCWDKATMKTFFASLKNALVHHQEYQPRADVTISACAATIDE